MNPQDTSAIPENILRLDAGSVNGYYKGDWVAPQKSIDLRPTEEQDFPGRELLLKSCTARLLSENKGKRICMYGYLVTVKTIRTVRGERMSFGCFIDYEGHFLDTIHFPPCLQKYPFRGVGVYRLVGKAVDEFGFLSLEVDEMEKLPRKTDPRAARG